MAEDPAYDVAIIGAGTAGLATALRLLQAAPGRRVLIIERDENPPPQPALALSESATAFLGRTLGLGAHLNESHYTRQGTRFWFTNGDPRQTLDACSEIGPRYLARLPSYLVDRALLDAEMRRRAIGLGATLRRPATVTGTALRTLTLSDGETIPVRWIVDASGSAAFLAHQEGWRRPMEGHPLQTAWARFRGVKDWDSPELRRRFPAWAAATFGMRNPALNCLAGDGWQSGWAPLRGGEVSVQLTGDRRLTTIPTSGDEMRAFLETRHPVARELLAGAVMVEGSFGWCADPAFRCERLIGEGFALVGGAAGWIDPLGEGDWLAVTVEAAALAIGRDQPSLGYTSWIEEEPLYCDKYQYIGEFDLMSAAYILELGLSHLAPRWGTRFQGLIHRRCVHLAKGRRARATLGRSNAGRRVLFTSFNLNWASGAPLLGALRRWLWLELTEGWR